MELSVQLEGVDEVVGVRVAKFALWEVPRLCGQARGASGYRPLKTSCIRAASKIFTLHYVLDPTLVPAWKLIER